MNHRRADDSESRFAGYVEGLASVIGHKDREEPLRQAGSPAQAGALEDVIGARFSTRSRLRIRFWRATSLRCISGLLVPSCSFWSKVSSSGLVSSYSVPQQMPYRRRPPAPHYPPSSPRCIRLALLGLTCEAPPAPSSVAMDLKAQGLRRSPAAPTARPRRLMRSAADLDAGVEVEPGQRRLTGGRRARFPAEESQPDPVGRTPRPRPVDSPERRTSRCATRSWGRSAPAFPGAWTLRGTIVYPKAYPE
jgi:hypothetical protein